MNTGAPLLLSPQAAAGRVLGIQRKLHKWASDEKNAGSRTCTTSSVIPPRCVAAGAREPRSRSAGIDGQTAHRIERPGRAWHGSSASFVRSFARGASSRCRSRNALIPKRSGKLRYLGIPTVRDRVVQAALKLVLEPIFEADFQPCSYGFRPGRRAQDAIAEVQHFTFRSYEWVVEGDIEACFDRDRPRGPDGPRAPPDRRQARVWRLVKAFLKAGILRRARRSRETRSPAPRRAGSSRRCWPTSPSAHWTSISPGRGRRWAPSASATTRRKRGKATYRLVRYADDFVVCVAGTRQHAEALVTETAQVLRPLGLTLVAGEDPDHPHRRGPRLPRLAHPVPSRNVGQPTGATSTPYPAQAGLSPQGR